MSKTWRCFHCDMNFANPTLAADHFGPSVGSDPVCKIDAKRIREVEAELARYREEDTDLHREIHRLQCEHQQALLREEEKGYARGLAEYRDVMPLLDKLVERVHNLFGSENQTRLYHDIVAIQKRLGK